MDAPIPYFHSFPKGFRQKEVDSILSAAKRGKNLQLIGLKGSGKSQIFRYISSSAKIKSDFNVVQVDFNLIPERSSTAVSKLILDKLSEWENSALFTKKTIVLADSFENITNILNDSLARVFESITTKHREFISFVFSVNQPIDSGNIYWGEPIFVSPFSKSDFEWFYKGLNGKDADKEKIYKSSGGYISLIKRLCEVALSGQDLDAVINNPRLNPHILYQLELMKEGLRGKQNYFDVPIYNTFLNGVVVGSELTALENKAYQFLFKNKDLIVEREDLITAVWGERATRGIADHALDQLIHRLKVKIAKDGYKIETLRGRGHRLV